MNSLDQGFLTEIRQVGYHPFLMMRFRQGSDPAERYSVCLTQNDAAGFVHALNAEPFFSESLLLRGIERALQTEIYDAAELLFRWVKGEGEVTEIIYGGLDETTDLFYHAGYPGFEFGGRSVSTTPRERAGSLASAQRAYSDAAGNDGLRFLIIEAFGLALSRSFGSLGDYNAAAHSVKLALEKRPYSFYLKSADHALTQQRTGAAVTPRLVKFIGEDDGCLKPFICPYPFKRFDIGPSGDVLLCCGHWLPTSVGNFQKDSVPDILNSPTALNIRKSVTDGTYKYCNHLECALMTQDELPRYADLKDSDSHVRRAVDTGDHRLDSVREVLFAFDQSCNLSCPSCRRDVITERASRSDEKAKAIEEKLLPLLPKLKLLNLNPAGELFASKPSRKLLELINDDLCPDLEIEIISNGTLFSETEWNKFPGIHNKVREIRISIDAAHKITFEKLRRLGNYDTFLRNIRFLSRLRRERIVSRLRFAFTYQRDNYFEMRDFVEFGREMNADLVIFERLQNLGAFTDDEYRDRAVHYPAHHLYSEFVEVMRDPIFQDKIVFHDFDYSGVIDMTREEALDRAH
jgi:MoaA/NifB/PqqE/SkfB family radical SAM enzyme